MKQEIIEKINKYFLKRIPILLFLFVLVNLFAYLPSFNIFIDIFSHFKLQYFFISIIFLLFSIYLTFINKKLLICTIISLIMIAVNLIGICPQYIPFEPSSSNAASIKLGVFNVLTSNSQYPLLIKEIEEQQPDIIILQETDNIWLNNIKQLKNEYPYYIEHPRDDNFGTALYSKIPLKSTEVEKWTNLEIPVVKACFKLNNNEIVLYGIHTLPPTGHEYISIRNEMLKKIQGLAHSNNKNLIIAGDLNTSAFSYAFTQYIKSTKLKDAQTQNKILKGTWNAKHPFFMRISLDHVLYSEFLGSSEFRIGNSFGSDHLPVFVNISTKE